MSDDLVTFLRARLDEDERAALAVDDNSEPWRGQWVSDEGRAVRTYNGWVLVYPHENAPLRPGLVEHIARHDPARVLREVEAKRRMLELHELVECKTYSAGLPIVRSQCGYCASLCHSRSGLGCDEPIDALWPCDTVRLLARPYAGHPDYRDEWKP